ncbi:MAG: enoyl-CoA hydratase/isomerase family protein [Ignavibacteriales bacterium]|nr:enoyl-CoA hydratase/isomerase family protein [Ignavibacteriales bacterium]
MSKYSGVSPGNLRLKNVLYEKEDWVATITINRPEVHNCLNYETLVDLRTVFQDATWDDHVAVVVVTGAGDRAFCTGADMKEWNEDFLRKPNDFYKWMGVFIETYDRLRNIGKPTIARLNGMVVGGGNELNMSCDLAIAADDINIRQIGTMRGSVPSAGATQWLPLIVGERRAREILFLCEEIPARKALEWGLVNEVVPRKDLDAAVRRMAKKLIEKLPECTRYTKQQLNFWRDFSWAMTIGHVRDWLTVHTAAPEIIEGITAFTQKRPIDYVKIREMMGEIRSQKSEIRDQKTNLAAADPRARTPKGKAGGQKSGQGKRRTKSR